MTDTIQPTIDEFDAWDDDAETKAIKETAHRYRGLGP